jgi:hypothetical protein
MSGSASAARETCDCDIYKNLCEGGTSAVQSTAWSRDLRVTADGSGVVSHAGAALLRMLADRAGLTGALSAGLARRGRWPVHDRGRVLVDLAVLIANGGEAIADIDVLRHQREVFGAVASDTTVWRALDEIGAGQLRRIARARAKVRARMWQLFGGPRAARAAGRDIGAGLVVLDVDSTIVLAHSDKDGATPTYKHSLNYGFVLVWVARPTMVEKLGMPRLTVLRWAASWSSWVSFWRAPARLIWSPSTSPSQPSRRASSMRACRLSRISSMRRRPAGSGRRSGQRRHECSWMQGVA